MITWNAYTNTDLRRKLRLKDKAGATYPTTGHTLTTELRKSPKGPLVSTGTVTIEDAAAGEIEVHYADSDLLNEGVFFLDVKLIRTSDSEVIRSAQRKVVLEDGVTA